MKKIAFILCAALLALALGGCAAVDADYTEYNGVKIPNVDIVNMRNMYIFIDETNVPSDDELLATLTRQQVQLDEAERLGLMPSKAEAEKNYMVYYIEPIMELLASDEPLQHEDALFFLMLLQEQGKALGLSHDEFCDYLITQWQRMMGMGALEQYVLSQPEVLSQRGFSPDEPWEDPYGEYVDGLLTQAASAAAQN